jgi:cyclopropane fatty-acyl-phospholipid synthase-like methyltransferase
LFDHCYSGDINVFDLPASEHGTYDLVISIEMFEHMKNYDLLMRKVASWLKQNGKVRIVCMYMCMCIHYHQNSEHIPSFLLFFLMTIMFGFQLFVHIFTHSESYTIGLR